VTHALRRGVRAVTRAPAVHFLVLGALLFAVSTRFAAAPEAARRKPIVITAARIAEIRDDYQRSMEADPTPTELTALIDREAEEQMLYQEALLLGLDRGDRTVEWRVVEKMRFLYGDDAGDNAAAFRRGLALGLDRDDIMVRNTLVTKMRLLAKAASRQEEPEGAALDQALEQYFHDHRDSYAQAARLTVAHVFVNATRHDDDPESAARALQRRLQAAQVPPEDAAHWGDAFAAGSTFRNASASNLVKIFGDECASVIAGLEPGRWSEPIRSPFGLHLVWVSDRQDVSVPPLEAVRSQVLRAYRAERHTQYLARMLAQLHEAYEVHVERESYASR